MDPKLAERLGRQLSKIDTGENDTDIWDGNGIVNVNTAKPSSELAKHLERQTAKIKSGNPIKEVSSGSESPEKQEALRRQPTSELARHLERQSAKIDSDVSFEDSASGDASPARPESSQSQPALESAKLDPHSSNASTASGSGSPIKQDSLQKQASAELAQRLNRQCQKLVTNDSSAIEGVRSVAQSSERVQSDLAKQLEKRRSRIESGDTSALNVQSRSGSKDEVSSELAQKFQRHSISDASHSIDEGHKDVGSTEMLSHGIVEGPEDVVTLAEEKADGEPEGDEQVTHNEVQPVLSGFATAQQTDSHSAKIISPMSEACSGKRASSSRALLAMLLAFVALLVALWFGKFQN
jgi:hypothetical protein